MFKKTRKQLTFIYSGIIGMVLVIMTVSFYITLLQVLQQNEKNRIADVAQETLQAWNANPAAAMKWDTMESNQFALVVNANGEILDYSIKDPNSQLIQTIQKRISERRGYKSHFFIAANEERTSQYAIFGFPIKDGSQNILYLGEDVREDIKLLNQMKLLVVIFSVILLVVATGIGYIFAGRAMVPITKAFKKQQEFTANASHELRTPLSVLLSSAEILEEQKSQLSSIHQQVLNNMQEEIRRMIQMVEHLLILARNDSNQQSSSYESFDIKEVIYAEVKRIEIIALEKQIEFVVMDLSPDNAMLYVGDSGHIHLLIYILLENAVKYSPDNSLVTIKCNTLGVDRCEIIISDQGYGIPQKDIPFIFDRFYRVDKARSRDSGGNGIGLAIAAAIVNNHGGKITVSSVINQGSSFHIYLPVKKRSSPIH
jgi:signal transduction histidine kinase